MRWWPAVSSIAVLPVLTRAQIDVDSVVLPNTTACPKYQQGCCEQASIEAKRACLEYGMFQANEESCRVWFDAILLECSRTCGNCSRMGDALFGQCVFMLQPLGNFQLVTQYCMKSKESFETARCPPSCETTSKDCKSLEKKACEAQCGNYQSCICSQPRGSIDGESLSGRTCEGSTILRGTECNSVPQHCSHHWTSNNCSRYKWCDLDLCVVKEVVCETDNMCADLSFCNPSTGLCSFQPRANGFSCDDGLSYTNNDTCQDGTCIGEVDLCKQYNITCDSGGSCATAIGHCLPYTGRCVYTPKPDGELCNDKRKWTLEDKCLDGVCQGRQVNLCADIELEGGCFAKDDCHLEGFCDPRIGECVPQFVPNVPVTKCDDKDPSTVNDRCIDGVCVGERFPAGKFRMLGHGVCTDRMDRSMPQYFKDVADEDECQDTCAQDPQCAAYAYSYPVCRLYGTVRLSAPSPGWAYLPGDDPPAFAVEKSSGQIPGGRSYICSQKSEAGNPLEKKGDYFVSKEYILNPHVMAGLFLVLGLIFLAKPIYKTCWQKESDAKLIKKSIASSDQRNSSVLEAWPPIKDKELVGSSTSGNALETKMVEDRTEEPPDTKGTLDNKIIRRWYVRHAMRRGILNEAKKRLKSRSIMDEEQLLPGQVPDNQN